MHGSTRSEIVLRLATVVIVVTITSLSGLQATSAVRAQDSAQDHAKRGAKEDPLLWAARVCYLEATWRKADCVALLWVTRRRARRAGRPWLDVLRSYSAIDTTRARARATREFPWGDIPDKSDSFNRSWRKLRELVVAFSEGKLKNPCPHAEHWGGTMDHARGRMIPVRCAVSTANTFYRVRR